MDVALRNGPAHSFKDEDRTTLATPPRVLREVLPQTKHAKMRARVSVFLLTAEERHGHTARACGDQT